MFKPSAADPPRIVAIANQKGGVGKTTTAINLGAALAELGQSVLVVDLDPQGNASTGLGIPTKARIRTTYDLLFEDVPLREIIMQSSTVGLSVIPATTDLSSADLELGAMENRSFMLRDALRQPDMGCLGFDLILIDCPPSLSLLTINGMVAADTILIPLQSEFFALEGLSQLMLTIRQVRQTANPNLRIEGVVLTMVDVRNNLSLHVERDVRASLGEIVFKTVIPRNVRISEAPSFSIPVLTYDGGSKGSTAYRGLAAEVLSRHGNSKAET